jgi:hypothetical protein
MIGHLVIFDSYSDSGTAAASKTLAHARGVYYAYGASGWIAFLADQGSTADQTTLQMQLTNDAGGLLGQATHGGAPPAASVDAQQMIMHQVASALTGNVAN